VEADGVTDVVLTEKLARPGIDWDDNGAGLERRPGLTRPHWPNPSAQRPEPERQRHYPSPSRASQ
jgi:hypothetical protein